MAVSCFTQNETSKEIEMNRKAAERVWELAVQAQGGRDKLLSIRNEVVITKERGHITESLFVFPNKWWNWDDLRPTMFGVVMRMENYETRQNYIARAG